MLASEVDTVTMNINDRVRVKLTERGRQLHLKHFNELYASYGRLRPTYVPPREDVDGWSEWTMWDLMREYGRYLHNGVFGEQMPFRPDIMIVRPPLPDFLIVISPANVDANIA